MKRIRSSCFRLFSYAVKDVIFDDWFATQKAYDDADAKDSVLYVNGVPDGTCAWKQPD